MIVCHCQSISDHDIRAAITWMRASDAGTIITAGKIYRALGKRADCGGCMPLFLDSMRKCANLGVATPSDQLDRPSQNHHPIPHLRSKKGLPDERRRESY